MTADNTKFDMVCVPIKPALEIAFATSPSGKATHYKVYEGKLVFAWNEAAGKDFIPFLSPISAEEAIALVKNWLLSQDYGSEPDIDGSSDKSHRIWCESWGLIDHNQYTFVAIEPAWAMYGK